MSRSSQAYNNLFKYLPVWLAGFAAMSSGVPTPTASPPPAPPSGPMSMIPSAVLITCVRSPRWCCRHRATGAAHATASRCRRSAGRSRLVQDVEGAAGVALGQFQGQLSFGFVFIHPQHKASWQAPRLAKYMVDEEARLSPVPVHEIAMKRNEAQYLRALQSFSKPVRAMWRVTMRGERDR
jgi:hypothetical protein